MSALVTASSESGGGRFVALLVLVVLIIVVVLLIVRLRPRLRERRHEAWRRAGLLPEQLDRDTPRDDEQ